MSAMDVICVEDENGEYNCTPFYAGFSNSGIFAQATEEKVHLIVNYKPIHEVSMVKDVNGFVLFEGKGSIEGRRTPSQRDLRNMGLKKGSNSIAFATANTNQMISSKIYVWEQNEKIIVTDIDGTITRSDKRGHFYSRIGLSWHHNSVVTCFQTLFNMGYKILYLTARSVTMDNITRKYLDDLQLPCGPLLLSSKGFMDAFTSEVITKDAKLDLNRLFPPSNEVPIVAGFGNNENDEWAYKEAKVPPDHIFIVNKKSEIMVAKAKTSYESVQKEVCKFFKSLVDQLKHSSEMLPENNNNTDQNKLDKNTENPIKDFDSVLSESGESICSDVTNDDKETEDKDKEEKDKEEKEEYKEINAAEVEKKQGEEDYFDPIKITRGFLSNLNQKLRRPSSDNNTILHNNNFDNKKNNDNNNHSTTTSSSSSSPSSSSSSSPSPSSPSSDQLVDVSALME